jgi:peptide deformylase
MSVRTVLELGDPRLRTIAAAVPDDAFGNAALHQLVTDLIDTMRAQDGAGIAAPQIGVGQRVFVIEVQDNPRYPYKPTIPLTVLVNPVLQVTDATEISVIEGCLSVPNLRGRVARAAAVIVDARMPDGSPFQVVAQGLSAATLQHELDHLDGRLFVDQLSDPASLMTWANYDRYSAAGFRAEAEAINRAFPAPLQINK